MQLIHHYDIRNHNHDFGTSIATVGAATNSVVVDAKRCELVQPVGQQLRVLQMVLTVMKSSSEPPRQFRTLRKTMTFSLRIHHKLNYRVRTKSCSRLMSLNMRLVHIRIQAIQLVRVRYNLQTTWAVCVR